MAKEKARYFTFLLYPESIPEDWEIKLESIGLPIAVSPLHDKDLSDVEGQKYKKAHYHVIYVAKNPVTADSVRYKIKQILGANSIAMVQIIVRGMEGMYLYLTHESKDAIAKKKYVYDKADIKHLNNFDIDRYIVLDEAEKKEIERVILNIIYDNRLENVFDFMDFYHVHKDEYNLPDESNMFSILKSNTGMLKMFFDGAYQRNQKQRNIELLKSQKNDFEE